MIDENAFLGWTIGAFIILPFITSLIRGNKYETYTIIILLIVGIIYSMLMDKRNQKLRRLKNAK